MFSRKYVYFSLLGARIYHTYSYQYVYVAQTEETYIPKEYSMGIGFVPTSVKRNT